MPTKVLPSKPDLEHLRYQAKDLRRARDAGDPEAIQRIREFHPRFAKSTDASISEARFSLSDAYLAVAREYGFSNWARLKTHIEQRDHDDLALPHHERIKDPEFRRAVELLDAGDADGLCAHLISHRELVHQRVAFEGGNYFRNPTLLEFAAENPTRRGSLPPNIVQVVEVILDAGGKADQSSLDSTLALASSSKVARECGVQVPLIDAPCDRGADPNGAMLPALLYGEFEAVDALLGRGAKVNLSIAAATGRVEDARRLLPAAEDEERQRALGLAAQFGHSEIVGLLIDAGEDPNRFSPVGSRSHATPLHQAVNAGRQEVVRLLVERGARLDIRDIRFHGTPLEWAIHAGRNEIAEYLRARAKT